MQFKVNLGYRWLINNLVAALISILIFLCFSYVYELYIIKNFGYYGFLVQDISVVKKILAIGSYILITNLCRKEFKNPSDFFNLYLNFIVILPTCVMLYYGAVTIELFVVVIISSLIVFFTVGLGVFIPTLRFNPLQMQPKFVVPTLSLLAILLLSIYVKVKGGNINFNLFEIYTYRDSSSGSFTGVMAYFVKWLSYCVFPFMLLWGLFQKNKKIVFIALIGQVIIFGFTNHKSYFFNIVLILVVYNFFVLLDKYKFKNNLVFFQLFFLAFTFLILLLSITNYSFLGSLFFRRIFFWPVLISDNYINYSLVNGFLFYQNETPVADIISSHMGRDEEYTNTGFIANSYLQGGIIMSVILSFLVGFILLLYNRLLVNRLPLAVMSCFCIITFRPFLASDFLVALLSNGVAFMFLLQIILFNSFNPYVKK